MTLSTAITLTYGVLQVLNRKSYNGLAKASIKSINNGGKVLNQ